MTEYKLPKKTNFTLDVDQESRRLSRVGPSLSVTSDGRSRKSPGNKSTTSSTMSRRQTLANTGTIRSKDIRFYNSAGDDVTPRPLLANDQKSQLAAAFFSADNSSETTTEVTSQPSVQQAGTVINQSTFGTSVFARSVFVASDAAGSDASASEYDESTVVDFDLAGHTRPEYTIHDDDMERQLSEADLSREVCLKLSETDTMWLLDMPSICVMNESDEAVEIIRRNSRYEAQRATSGRKTSANKDAANTDVAKGRLDNVNEGFTERGINTFNDLPKHKNMQTDRILHREASTFASIWELYDTHATVPVSVKKEDEEDIMIVIDEVKADDAEEAAAAAEVAPPASSSLHSGLPPEKLSVADSVSYATSVFGAMGSDIGTKKRRHSITADAKAIIEAQIIQSDSLKRHLVIIERTINLNTYQKKQALYRNFEPIMDVDQSTSSVTGDKEVGLSQRGRSEFIVSDVGPNLDRLWSYQCSTTKGRNVSCIGWNETNPDLVAVGYGHFEYGKQDGGLLCCWSLKNPEFPERVYQTATGVMCLDFSKAHPNLLAAGLHDGTIAVFNVSIASNEPVLDSCEASGKHTSGVWQLKWTEKERGSEDDHAEVLVSVSTDGRVTQWAIRKGFECNDLIKLKRVSDRQTQSTTSSSGKTKKSDAMIAKFAGGLCFAFHPKDSNIYLVGTEEGHIHRCSCSYNEQYLDSYFGHTGPVYTLQWSPFDADMFLSCSADWSIRLWHQDRLQPILSLFSSTKAVPSLCWSPYNATVFACVNEGALEVWDLRQSSLDPVLVNVPVVSNVKMSCVSCAYNTDCLLVGDSDGQVSVFQLRGMTAPSDSQTDALQNIINTSLVSQFKK